MRISKLEVKQIVSVLSNFIKDKAEIRLYGSRVKDDLKGGDIDLLLLLDKPKSVENLLLKKHYILSEIKEFLGEQRIDLKITSKKEIEKDPFLQIILPNSILLHEWK